MSLVGGYKGRGVVSTEPDMAQAACLIDARFPQPPAWSGIARKGSSAVFDFSLLASSPRPAIRSLPAPLSSRGKEPFSSYCIGLILDSVFDCCKLNNRRAVSPAMVSPVELQPFFSLTRRQGVAYIGVWDDTPPRQLIYSGEADTPPPLLSAPASPVFSLAFFFGLGGKVKRFLVVSVFPLKNSLGVLVFLASNLSVRPQGGKGSRRCFVSSSHKVGLARASASPPLAAAHSFAS